VSDRIVVRYSVDLLCEGGNCFYLMGDGFTIRVVIREASSERVTVELPLRFRKPNPGALHIRPISSDLDSWLVESAVIHKDLARMELQLANVPVHVAKSLIEL
jgi:hypothetical protein